MIINKMTVDAGKIEVNNCLTIKGDRHIFSNALYLDLEHAIYKIPLCMGVLGTCSYNAGNHTITTEQYMIQNKKDAHDILYIARDLFAANHHKYIVTFAGENDFLVINFLFKKYKIKFNFNTHYSVIDLQKQYLKDTGEMIGLKNLEKVFQIERDALISGSNLAKTFGKIVRIPEYGKRMDAKKIDRILDYNFHDVVNLFHITTNWNKYVN
ncbi:MAG: ribonuclease H-like domain-containing protein [Firmicutes bacterium]|nr:ribonuclease H-like domain-containing protein [Bacillota bacterium]